MRVLHVVESLERGDAARYVAEHRAHAAHDVESVVWTLSTGGAPHDEVDPAGESLAAVGEFAAKPAVARHAWDPRALLERGLAAPASARHLARAMREQAVSVVHAHGPRAARIATLAATWAHAPVVIRGEYLARAKGADHATADALDELALRATHQVLCVCEAVRRSHAVRWGWAADRFVTVLGGVGLPELTSRETLRTELGIDADDKVVLLADTLTAGAAPQVALDAFRRVARVLPSACLVVADGGPLRADLERRAAEADLAGRVRFLSPGQDLTASLAVADVAVITRLRAGLPPRLLDTMAAGCPAVVARIGGTTEAVADGETGWLVPPNDPGATADALLNLLADPARARAFGAAARDRWQRSLSATRMVADTERMYRAALADVRSAAVERARAARDGWSDAAG